MDGLLEEMNSRQLAEWMAYARLEPFGSEVIDYQMAVSNSLAFNANRAKGEEAKPVDDFRLFRQIRQSSNDLWMRLKRWTLLSGD